MLAICDGLTGQDFPTIKYSEENSCRQPGLALVSDVTRIESEDYC